MQIDFALFYRIVVFGVLPCGFLFQPQLLDERLPARGRDAQVVAVEAHQAKMCNLSDGGVCIFEQRCEATRDAIAITTGRE